MTIKVNLRAMGLFLGVLGLILIVIAHVIMMCAKGETTIVNMVWAAWFMEWGFYSWIGAAVLLIINGLAKDDK